MFDHLGVAWWPIILVETSRLLYMFPNKLFSKMGNAGKKPRLTMEAEKLTTQHVGQYDYLGQLQVFSG